MTSVHCSPSSPGCLGRRPPVRSRRSSTRRRRCRGPARPPRPPPSPRRSDFDVDADAAASDVGGAAAVESAEHLRRRRRPSRSRPCETSAVSASTSRRARAVGGFRATMGTPSWCRRVDGELRVHMCQTSAGSAFWLWGRRASSHAESTSCALRRRARGCRHAPPPATRQVLDIPHGVGREFVSSANYATIKKDKLRNASLRVLRVDGDRGALFVLLLLNPRGEARGASIRRLVGDAPQVEAIQQSIAIEVRLPRLAIRSRLRLASKPRVKVARSFSAASPAPSSPQARDSHRSRAASAASWAAAQSCAAIASAERRGHARFGRAMDRRPAEVALDPLLADDPLGSEPSHLAPPVGPTRARFASARTSAHQEPARLVAFGHLRVGALGELAAAADPRRRPRRRRSPHPRLRTRGLEGAAQRGDAHASRPTRGRRRRPPRQRARWGDAAPAPGWT